MLAEVPPEATYEDAQSFLPLGRHVPGAILLITEGLSPADIVYVLRACVRSQGPWTPVLVESHEGALQAFPLGHSRGHAMAEVARAARDPESALALTVEQVVGRVRAARHEINNPLAAALVEVQLLLMDAAEEDLRRGLSSVEEQLRTIKQRVADLGLPGVRRAVGEGK